MDSREFFNSLAYKWDDMCHHDDKKIRDILELADILGHSNIETTRMYTLTSIKEKRNALERLEL